MTPTEANARARARAAPALATEARVIAELLANPDALDLAPELEVDDFTFLPHRWIFATLRNLQAHGHAREVLDVADAIAMGDLEHGSHCSHTVDPIWLARLISNAPPYGAAFDVVFAADLRHLRIVTLTRAAALKAA